MTSAMQTGSGDMSLTVNLSTQTPKANIVLTLETAAFSLLKGCSFPNNLHYHFHYISYLDSILL
jgi:hypothetical protein